MSKGRTTPISPGLQVGEYRIEEKIGAGGMGTVYRAAGPAPGKKVAIKILAGGLARNTNAIRRFVLEARTVNEIRHANLVDVISFGQITDGRYYYVMEYLAGRSLGAVLRARGRLPAGQALPVFADVLRALEATHAKGVVHRDLKPDNVFLVRNEGGAFARAKLLDFGLAKLLEPEKTLAVPLTAAGMAVGTPHYMSPEQCLAKPVDARSDLYAFGVMLYETLTGQLPCDGSGTLEIWEAHVRRPPRRPREVAPDAVSEAIDVVVMKLLAKDPAARFQSATAALAALQGEAGRLPLSSLSVDDDSPSGLVSSASRVGRAIPSSVHSSDTVPIGGPAEDVAVPVGGATELHDVLGLDIEQPSLASNDPSQVSAINIRLSGVRPADAPPPPAPLRLAPPAPASTRVRPVRPRSARLGGAHRPRRWSLLLVAAGAILAALAAVAAMLQR